MPLLLVGALPMTPHQDAETRKLAEWKALSEYERGASTPNSVLCRYHEREAGGECSYWGGRPLLNDSCPACVVMWDMDAAICAARQEARRERDHEWWEALACVDNVEPTPEDVKKWILLMAETRADEKARAARREALEDAEKALHVLWASASSPWRNERQESIEAIRALATPSQATGER